MAFRNRVTEQPLLPNEFWVVSAEWKAGHDKRRVQLENIHTTEKAALKDWERIDPESRTETDFKRHPIRHFRTIEQANGEG